jgi:hypothetical protein
MPRGGTPRVRVSGVNRGGLNNTHIHGTSVPVEEPSTASKAEITRARPGLI